MTQETPQGAPQEQAVTSGISMSEFIALIAMMFATIAFSIDAMLPALPEIGRELSPDNINKAQLILTSFVIGMGFGTFFTGPLSDTFGRKPVLLAGAALYIVGAIIAWMAQSLEVLLAARVLQGLGAAGPRVVSMAVVRDLFEGREMARLMSIAMLIFMLVPAVAPSIGAVIIAVSDWRGVFLAFILFSVISSGWYAIRHNETLPPKARRPFEMAALMAAVGEVLGHPMVRISIAVQMLCFAMLFGMLSSVQQVFDITFGRGESFPIWFGVIALVSGSASLLNAALVMRFGMRQLITIALVVQFVITGLVIISELFGLPNDVRFGIFVFWQTSVFFQGGMVFGNLNAMAMQPMGHIAGLAASVTSGLATVGAMIFAVPIGLAFDGTPMPLFVGSILLTLAGVLLMLWLRQIEK